MPRQKKSSGSKKVSNKQRSTSEVNNRVALYNPNIIKSKDGSIHRKATTTGGMNTNIIGSSSSSGQSIAQTPMYYDYRWSTPDKFYFPRNRVVANSIFREMYKRDATIGAVTDLYAEMPWSDFDLIGIDDKSIKALYEAMFSELNVVPKLSSYSKDYLITGENVLHATFDTAKGYWTNIIPHNPDYIRVEGVGLVGLQPLLWLRPTPEIKRLLSNPDPRVKKLHKLLPAEVVSSFRANKEVPLDPLNTTFLPRLNSSHDLRGTSIFTRLFRITMYEDFVTNASLAVAQRNAAPLRIFKLGDPATGWLPTQEDEAALAQMLSMAEQDPMSAIITHNNLSVELVGVSDRVLLISREWEFIERVKLLAMGVSKTFLVGEASFASATAGLQVLLEKLSSLRAKYEKQWLLEKICKPIAQMHKFVKRTQAELDHRIRINRTDSEEYIVPQIKWRKSLEPTQDVALLGIWRDLKDRGLLSDRTYAAGAGLDLDAERKNIKEEQDYSSKNIPAIQPGAEQPGPGATPPTPPMGVETNLKRNPYNPTKNEILDAIHDVVASDNTVQIQDLEEVIENAFVSGSPLETKLSEVESTLNLTSDKNLLSGL